MNKMNIAKIFVSLLITCSLFSCKQTETPSYLKNYQALYQKDPKKANLEWFKDAKFGLFIHYGIYAWHGRGEWVLRNDTIPLDEYKKVAKTFNAENFDADFITGLALDAGMKYITITAKHHDGFCLFKTQQTDWNSMNTPCRRDLIGELYDACEEKGLGLFLYYSYGVDWYHPYALSLEDGCNFARPAYETLPAQYKYRKPEDHRHYIDYVHEHLKEMLSQYPNIAGIWFDPIMGYYMYPDVFPVDETYALIRSLSPTALITFKQGANGDEDFIAPERFSYPLDEKVKQRGGSDHSIQIAKEAWEKNQGKPKEICNTLQPHAWGYKKADDNQHKTADDVMNMLEEAEEMDANLLLNIGPLFDGSVYPDDVLTLREVGKRLRKK
jgi:alpha-L-fucosidase